MNNNMYLFLSEIFRFHSIHNINKYLLSRNKVFDDNKEGEKERKNEKHSENRKC